MNNTILFIWILPIWSCVAVIVSVYMALHPRHGLSRVEQWIKRYPKVFAFMLKIERRMPKWLAKI